MKSIPLVIWFFFALGSHMSVVDDMLPIVNNGIVFMHGEEELHAIEEKWGDVDRHSWNSKFIVSSSQSQVKKKCALFYHQPQKPIQNQPRRPTRRNAAGSNLHGLLCRAFLRGKPQTIV